MVTHTPDASRENDEPLVAHARALKTRTPSGQRWELVVDACPRCGLAHAHGGGKDETPVYGHRAAHCADRDARGNGYELVPVDGAV